ISCLFFFSSRRRHTRSKRDWSSDVCSSDLEVRRVAVNVAAQAGSGYASSARHGKKGPSPSWNVRKGPGYQGRARAIVYPETFRAMRDNAKNNTLVKIMGGPGGY